MNFFKKFSITFLFLTSLNLTQNFAMDDGLHSGGGSSSTSSSSTSQRIIGSKRNLETEHDETREKARKEKKQ